MKIEGVLHKLSILNFETAERDQEKDLRAVRD